MKRATETSAFRGMSTADLAGDDWRVHRSSLITLQAVLSLGGHPDLLSMSLSRVLLTRYGSPEAVDQVMGEGPFTGVKQVHGGLSAWRQPWSHVRKERKAQYIAQRNAIDGAALCDLVAAHGALRGTVRGGEEFPGEVAPGDPSQHSPAAPSDWPWSEQVWGMNCHTPEEVQWRTLEHALSHSIKVDSNASPTESIRFQPVQEGPDQADDGYNHLVI